MYQPKMYCPICGETCEHLGGSLWGVSHHYCGECEKTWTITNIPEHPYTVQDKGEEK